MTKNENAQAKLHMLKVHQVELDQKLNQLTLRLNVPNSHSMMNGIQRHEVEEKIDSENDCKCLSNLINSSYSGDDGIRRNDVFVHNQQNISFTKSIIDSLMQARKHEKMATEYPSSTPIVSPTISNDQNRLQSHSKISKNKNEVNVDIIRNESNPGHQNMYPSDVFKFNSRLQSPSLYKQRSRKIKRLEQELDDVKSSWEKEIRYVRYNMEILRNEVITHLMEEK